MVPTRRAVLAGLSALGCAPLFAGCSLGPARKSEVPELRLESRWRHTVGLSVLGCAVAGDTFVYVAGWDERPTQVHGVDVTSGASIWQLEDRDRLDLPGVGKVKARLDRTAV